MAPSKKRRGAGKPAPKAKGAAAKKAKAKAEKITIEQLSDIERQRLLFQHKRKVRPLLEQKAEITRELNAAFEVAKREGIPKKEVILAIDFEDSAKIEKYRKAREQENRVARWSGVAKQLDMFGDGTETVRQRLFEDGRIAAFNDMPASPPASLSQKDAQVWLEGHAAGRTVLNTERASGGFRSLGDVASQLPLTGGDNVEKIGTQAPTYKDTPGATPLN